MNLSELLSQYGFPIVFSIGMGAVIYYIWKWATQDMAEIIEKTDTTLIHLINKLRTLDNDMIRLTEKVKVVMQLRKLKSNK